MKKIIHKSKRIFLLGLLALYTTVMIVSFLWVTGTKNPKKMVATIKESHEEGISTETSETTPAILLDFVVKGNKATLVIKNLFSGEEQFKKTSDDWTIVEALTNQIIVPGETIFITKKNASSTLESIPTTTITIPLLIE